VAAARALKVAMSRSPGLSEAHAAIGRLLVETGAVDEGIRRLEAAIAIDPDAPSARQELGRALALTGEWDRAYAQFEELRARDDEMAFWTMRARMAMWRREPEVAESYLRRLRDDDRTMRVPSVMLAVVAGHQRVEDLAANLDAAASAGTGGLRRRSFFYQLRAEFLAYFGNLPGVVDSVEKALAVGLIDRLWMERCPVLAEAREHPSMAPHRAELHRRAEAILAAYRAA
jgi:serine/threonine-protein kinase